jgi:hypothetical protein
MKTERKGADIDREVEETIAAFDRRDALPPDPRFYGRIMARLDREGKPRGAFAAVWKPALLAVLAVMNLTTAIWYLGVRPKQTPIVEQTSLRQVLAADLNLGTEPEWPFNAGQE